MEPTERGRFCARFDREVFDITELSSSEAIALFAKADGAIPCVRARTDPRGDPAGLRTQVRGRGVPCVSSRSGSVSGRSRSVSSSEAAACR